MSENVFNIVQFGSQGGTAYAPGAAVAASVLIPVEAPVNFLLDRAATYPKQDRGRNVRNSAGTGFLGVRGADVVIPGQVHFEDLMDFLEMHFSGGVTPTGAAPGSGPTPSRRSPRRSSRARSRAATRTPARRRCG